MTAVVSRSLAMRRDVRYALVVLIPSLFAGVAQGASGVVGADGASIAPVDLPDALPTIVDIFTRNAAIALIAAFGAVTLGLVGVFFGALQGFGLGLETGVIAGAQGWREVLLRTGPHAVLELPALALAVAAGFVPLAAMVARASGRDVPELRSVAGRFFRLAGTSGALLAMAAIVEVLVDL